MSRKNLAAEVWRAADIMRSDDGTNGINEYIEQTSWMFFLKVFEDLENRFEAEHQLEDRKYERIIDKQYSWSTWTKRKWQDEELMIKFIDKDLFPYLASLSGTPERNIIGLIFAEVKRNKMKSAYNLKDVIDIIDEIDFNNPEDSHILSQFYEDLLVKLGKESGIAGEFYTPRPVVRFMVKVTDPQLYSSSGKIKRLIDPFCGSCGFLVESYKHMIRSKNVSAKNYRDLQREVFHGAEKKSLPYLVGMMNCILHGLLTPSVFCKNSLNENVLNFKSEDKFDYILTNPPFGAKEGKNIQENFPVKMRKTELLALQSVMRRLSEGGKCAIVVPEPILWRSSKYLKVRKDLVDNFNVHTIISLPAGVFANVTSSGLGPKTNLLFFDKRGKTKEIWYYELTPPNSKTYSRVNTIKDEDLLDCFNKWLKKEESKNSWLVKVEDLDADYDLTANNPNVILGFNTKNPKDILSDVITKEKEVHVHLNELLELLPVENRDDSIYDDWPSRKIETCLQKDDGVQSGFACSKKNIVRSGILHLRPYNIAMNGQLDFTETAYLPPDMVDTRVYSLKKGDVIFNNTNSKELVGKAAIVDNDIVCGFSNHLTRLRTDRSIVKPEWLLLALRLHWLSGLFHKKSRKWIGQAGINTPALLNMEIPVPSISIQEKIISDLDKSTKQLDNLLRLSSAIEEEMKILRTSVFKFFILNKS